VDLISIAEILWRRKIVTIPLIVLTALGAYYVVKVKPPIYQAESSLLMVPPNPPTSAQIAADPSLAKINPNNPYLNYGDFAVVADTLIDVVTDSANEQVLVAQGADPRYTLALSTDYGNPPIVEITGVGRTPAIAMRSAELVTKAAEADLVTLQGSQGVNSLYMIKASQLVTPTYASQSVSGKLRTLVAVFAVGVLALFVAISLIEAVEKRRRGKPAKAVAKDRAPQADRPRAPFLSRYRTNPGWAPDDASSDAASGARRAASSAAPGRAPGATHGAPSPAVPPAHAAPAAPRREPRPDRQPVAPPARPGTLDRLPTGPTGRPGSRGR
jgi:capsular polysaccharide biosynthesis protein